MLSPCPLLPRRALHAAIALVALLPAVFVSAIPPPAIAASGVSGPPAMPFLPEVVLTTRAASLFERPDDAAGRVGSLPPDTPLGVLNAYQGRLHVVCDCPVRQGWVDVEDVQPPEIEDGPAPASPYRGDPWGFIRAVASAARVSNAQSGVPVSVTVAQAILESAWGESLLARRANNYFGVKGTGSNGLLWMPTLEFLGDESPVQLTEPFRAYRSLEESVADHDQLLVRLERYAPALAVRNDPRAFAQRLMEAGYSTDPEYADKLMALVARYDLLQLDASSSSARAQRAMPRGPGSAGPHVAV